MSKVRQPHHLELALELCRTIGTPYASRAAEQLCRGSYKLPSLDADAYSSADSFAQDYLIYSYLRKINIPGKRVDELSKQAIIGFKETEQSVELTNRNLRSKPLCGVESIISDARRKVFTILGRFDPLEWIERCEWGPGATSSLRSEHSTVDKKILEPSLTVTARALPYFKWILENDPHWFNARSGIYPDGAYSVLASNFSVVRSSRLTTVEKDSTTRRVIDIQPTANLYLQKGVGSCIRRRLKAVGINLDDQSRNQWLASVAVRLGLSTIDLAKASDTVSTELVRLLLPDDWFYVLDALRTTHTRVDGKELYLHKFSAMGNGYTFELESLLFYALCASTIEYSNDEFVLGVYGDDLVVPRRSSKNVVRVLRAVGFEVNSDKSFLRGRFFESCGRHYFDGVEVTPVYQREVIKDFTTACRAANRLFRYANRITHDVRFLDSRYLTVHSLSTAIAQSFWDEWMARRKTKGRKPVGFPSLPPWVEEDTGLLSLARLNVRNGLVRFRRIQLTPLKRPGDECALFALSLRRKCVTESPFLGLVTLRGKLQSVAISESGKTTWLPQRIPSWI